MNTDYFPMDNYYVACSRVGKPDNLFIWTDNGTAKNLYIYIYIYINKLSVCVCRVPSCLCVDWRHVCWLTKLHTGKSGHKWRPGHWDSKRKRPGHKECSISNHHQQSSRAIVRKMRYRSEYGLFSHGQQFSPPSARKSLRAIVVVSLCPTCEYRLIYLCF